MKLISVTPVAKVVEPIAVLCNTHLIVKETLTGNGVLVCGCNSVDGPPTQALVTCRSFDSFVKGVKDALENSGNPDILKLFYPGDKLELTL